jgi:predicted nucleotidyltransferase
MSEGFLESINKSIIYQWEMDEMQKPQKTSQEENDFGGDNIVISGLPSSASFKKASNEEDKFDDDSDMSPDEKDSRRNSAGEELKRKGLDREDEFDEEPLGEFTSSEIPWMTPRTQVQDPWIKLHNEMVEFVRFYGPTEESNEIRRALFLKVKNVIKKFFPGAIVKMFGSTAAILYLPRSDIDIVVFLPNSSNDMKSARRLHKLINKISWVKS